MLQNIKIHNLHLEYPNIYLLFLWTILITMKRLAHIIKIREKLKSL